MNGNAKRKLAVLENAPPQYLKLAKELLSHPKNFSAAQICEALNAIGKHGKGGTEPAADTRPDLYAAGATSTADLLGKDMSDLPQAFCDPAPSSFNASLFKAGAENAKALKQFMASTR